MVGDVPALQTDRSDWRWPLAAAGACFIIAIAPNCLDYGSFTNDREVQRRQCHHGQGPEYFDSACRAQPLRLQCTTRSTPNGCGTTYTHWSMKQSSSPCCGAGKLWRKQPRKGSLRWSSSRKAALTGVPPRFSLPLQPLEYPIYHHRPSTALHISDLTRQRGTVRHQHLAGHCQRTVAHLQLSREWLGGQHDLRCAAG